ncbi:hypothetical protein CHU92_06030 [Flavobacterium cyanobacteriorum]|uniref:Uncharacterized protein n=1 Tax=Flavobacterium cyanobacteriorum TaxID=2022802 RepID=A0A255Z9W0_9FLAO|nr:hypothetical protein [Flavobacterium cyanobacteriorum]OYQ38236.1 hypothetical protein CHU92_06030 [Flavobacterium cyanobacteriorum]
MNRIVFALFFISCFCFGQKTDVAELQLKLEPNASEELLYGFAAGDKILFTVEEAGGKTISEVAVAEYPQTFKYRELEVKKEKNREFRVNQKAVYSFTFANKSKESRICRVKIQRVPASSDTRAFNTAVKWATVHDTLWNTFTRDVVVGYDTVYEQKIKKVVAFEKRYEEVVLDKNQRVDAKTTLGQSRAAVAFTLPAAYTGKDETKKVVAWAYWVGVGEESNEFWKQNRKMIVGAVQGATTMFTSPLGGIAAGAVTNLILPTNGEDVEYALVNEANSRLFFQEKAYKSFDSGKGIAAYKRFTDEALMKGKYFIALINDNIVQPIDVNVKVSAIVEHIKYRDEKYTDRTITPRYEKKIVREPQIQSRKIPVTFDYR